MNGEPRERAEEGSRGIHEHPCSRHQNLGCRVYGLGFRLVQVDPRKTLPVFEPVTHASPGALTQQDLPFVPNRSANVSF